MRYLHLYWVKVFGCAIVEKDIAIDIASFSSAILGEKAHPKLYIAFGPAPTMPDARIAGASDMETVLLEKQCMFATWNHHIGDLFVNVMFAAPGEQRQGLLTAWHPRQGAKRLMLTDFEGR